MKKTYLFAVTAIFALTSCQKEDLASERSDELVFTASIADHTTKTIIDTDPSSEYYGNVSWKVNDEISVSDGSNTAVYYIEKDTDIAEDGSATFTNKSSVELEDAQSYTAYYGDITKQTYSPTAGNIPMSGKSDSGNKTKLNFAVTSCALLKINLQKLSEESEVERKISKIEVSGNNSYTLDCSEALPPLYTEITTPFYIAVYPGYYNRFLIYDGDHVCVKRNNDGMDIEDENTINTISLSNLYFSAKLDANWFAVNVGAGKPTVLGTSVSKISESVSVDYESISGYIKNEFGDNADLPTCEDFDNLSKYNYLSVSNDGVATISSEEEEKGEVLKIGNIIEGGYCGYLCYDEEEDLYVATLTETEIIDPETEETTYEYKYVISEYDEEASDEVYIRPVFVNEKEEE